MRTQVPPPRRRSRYPLPPHRAPASLPHGPGRDPAVPRGVLPGQPGVLRVRMGEPEPLSAGNKASPHSRPRAGSAGGRQRPAAAEPRGGAGAARASLPATGPRLRRGRERATPPGGCGQRWRPYLAAALGRQVPQQDLAPVAQLPAGARQPPRHLLGAQRRRLRGQRRAALGSRRHLAARRGPRGERGAGAAPALPRPGGA